ncbi:hypothetical protein KYB31_23120 [Clostridium felsineum]|uniref:hypothetical protein n=1 Tax=Clostridium felsineum TaxID=36839 RepID=UPI00358DB6A5|nr:hypothetical protein [Clostridium felsineum]
MIGQTTAVAASVLVAPEDIGAAASKASKAESLLGKVGTFSKYIAISSAENAKNILTLPGRTIGNLGSKVADLRTVLSEGKGIVGNFTKSVVVSSAKNAKSLITLSGRKVLNDFKKATEFVDGKLIPASTKAIKDFGKVLQDTGEDLKGLIPQREAEIPGVGPVSVGPSIEFSEVVNNLKNRIGEVKDNFVKDIKRTGNPSGEGDYSTEEWYNYLKDKYGQENVYLCTDEKALINSISEKLECYRTGIDGKVYGKTAVAYGKDMDTVSIATSNSHQYNPTILTDGETFNTDIFNKMLEDCNGDESVAYSKYYEDTLTKDYIKSLPDEYFTGKGLMKGDVISEMKKLTDAIENTKNEARIDGKFSKITGEPSYKDWNVENCAEVWSTRKAILNGAKFDDINFKCVETTSGNYAKPCENCKRTFRNLNNVGKVK